MAANIWLEPEIDGSDKTGDLRSSHLNGERIKALISEFMGKLSYSDWCYLPYAIPKIYYGSNVEATPINRSAVVYPEYYGYEVKARLDYGRDMSCVVLEVEHFCRSRFYGVAYREIWVSLDTMISMAERIHSKPIEEAGKMMTTLACQYDYKQREHNNATFKCTLRNLSNATTSFAKGLNEKAEEVNVKMS